MSAIDAVYPAARNPMAFAHLARNGLPAHVVNRLYLFWTDQPNAWVDVTTTLEVKFAALHEHKSQLHDPEGTIGRMREWAAATGEQIGVPAADAFRVLDIG
jgi:LmbE family N-acetylglucosaminyl deacetylase